MKKLVISMTEAGQRLDKYLARRLPNASKSFLYKMLRKKNITLNGKKAEGSEKIAAGDAICIFFSDETYETFAGMQDNTQNKMMTLPVERPDILYENDHILIVNKPSGLLSQKAKKEDISLVEQINAYLLQRKALTDTAFRAGVCNRLDRNTSGIVVAGKTILGTQHMTAAFRERQLYKYYICLAAGRITRRAHIQGFLHKDVRTNKVKVFMQEDALLKDALPIETEYIPLCSNGKATLLKVHLITGRSHQIRAHLAALGHAVVGDEKYGTHSVNSYFRVHYQITSQLLHAFQLKLPPDAQIGLPDGLNICTALPVAFVNVLKGEQLWEPGIPEALEALH